MTAPELTSNEAGEGLSTSRRAFMGRAAVGVAASGLVWAAPSILTLDAAAAASCGTGVHTLSWIDATSAANLDGALPNSPTATTSGDTIRTAAMGGVTATVTYTNPNGKASSGGGSSLGTCFSVIANEIGGNQPPAGTKAWYMQMLATAVGNHLTTSFAFRKAGVLIGLNSLSFTVYDIDRVNSPGNTVWTDQVRVSGTRNGTAVAATAATTGTPNISGSPGNTPTAIGTGNSNIAPTANTGNVTFTFNGPVDTVLVDYIAPEAARLPSTPFQFMGISNITWTTCV